MNFLLLRCLFEKTMKNMSFLFEQNRRYNIELNIRCPAGGRPEMPDWISDALPGAGQRCRIGYPMPCRGQAIKEKAGKSLESKLSDDFPAFSLSLLSDSNQRPRDYKSRALAN